MQILGQLQILVVGRLNKELMNFITMSRCCQTHVKPFGRMPKNSVQRDSQGEIAGTADASWRDAENSDVCNVIDVAESVTTVR